MINWLPTSKKVDQCVNTIGPFHAQCKKCEKIKNDDLGLFYVYFSSIMSYKYPFLEKNCPKHTKKICLDAFTKSLDSEHSGWDMYVQSPNFLPNAE